MTEMVLVLPLLMVVLALLFYFGHMGIRVQRASVMARYEVWRDVEDAPGPSGPCHNPSGHPMLNYAFFSSQARGIYHVQNDNGFDDEPYDRWIRASSERSADSARVLQAELYTQSGSLRWPNGHAEAMRIEHDTAVPLWQRIDGSITRGHRRIDNDWRYAVGWAGDESFRVDWSVGPDEWEASSIIPLSAHLWGARDAFFEAFDTELDNIDDEMPRVDPTDPTSPEYYNPGHLAGMIRQLYLEMPRYQGPIVGDEVPQ
jgi:hypothetical protein